MYCSFVAGFSTSLPLSPDQRKAYDLNRQRAPDMVTIGHKTQPDTKISSRNVAIRYLPTVIMVKPRNIRASLQ